MVRPRFDREELARLLGRPDPVVLEIGAHDGSHTRAFLDTFPGIRLFCFEPDPRPLARFRARIDDPRCVLVEAAVAAHDGRATLHQSGGRPSDSSPEEWDLSSSIRRPTGHLTRHPWCTFDRTIEVATLKLDTWLQDYPQIETIDFIWADVQGAEIDLIEGGRSVLARTRFLYTEFGDEPLYEGQIDLYEIQARLGTRWELLRVIDHDNALFAHRRDQKPGFARSSGGG